MGTENVADASHGQWRRSCIFCAAVVNKKTFWQLKSCYAINKDKRRLRIDNFLITVPF